MSRDKKVKVTDSTMRNPKASKFPASGKPSAHLNRGKLGEPLNMEWAGFDLSDPNLQVTCGAYNSLHDPLLKSFFKQPERKKQLLKQGLITADEKVLCSLKEFNQHTEYIKKVQLSWNKLYLQEQKQLLKNFMQEKVEGGVPEIIHPAHRRDRLISRGRSTFRNMLKKFTKAGDDPRDTLLAWEVTQRLHLEEFKKKVTRELRLKPVESRNSGAAVSAPLNTPASCDEGLAPPNKADQISSQKVEGVGGEVMMVEDLEHFQNKSALEAEEQNEPVPAGPSSSSLNFDSDRQTVSPDLEDATVLANGLLRKIEDLLRTYSDVSLPGVSSDESSELQSSPAMDEILEILNPSADFSVGGRSSLLSSVSSDITLMDLETSFHCPPASSSCSPVSSDSDGEMISSDSEVANDLVNGILKRIEDSLNLEMSFNPSPKVSSYSEARMVSPDSEAVNELVSGVLRKIQDSPSSERSLTETSSRDSFTEMVGMLESPSSSVSLRSSPASFESSDITLIDLETSLDSQPMSISSINLESDGQTVSPVSEVAMDLVSGILRTIEDSSSLVETSSIPSSHNLEYLEVTDAAAKFIDSVLQDVENNIRKSDSLDARGGSAVPPTTTNTPTGTKIPKMRKQFHAFSSISWESVRQIFTIARRSNKIHPA